LSQSCAWSESLYEAWQEALMKSNMFLSIIVEYFSQFTAAEFAVQQAPSVAPSMRFRPLGCTEEHFDISHFPGLLSLPCACHANTEFEAAALCSIPSSSGLAGRSVSNRHPMTEGRIDPGEARQKHLKNKVTAEAVMHYHSWPSAKNAGQR
jgi:hypothetical protein